MINQIYANLHQVWHMLELSRPMPTHMRYMLQSRNRVILFFFEENSGHPLIVVKLSRDIEHSCLLERSVHCAQQIRARLDDQLRETIPAMSLLPSLAGLAVVAEKFLTGEPIGAAVLRNKRMVDTSCKAFSEWLVQFQRTQQTGSVVLNQTWLEMLCRELSQISNIETKCKGKAENELAKLIGSQMPLVWAFGDAHPSNILLKNGRVSGVIDWEGTAPDKWPVFDWFQFVLSLSQEIVKYQYPDILERAAVACSFLMTPPSTHLAEVLQQQTERFFTAIDLDPELILPLFLAFLIDYYWIDNKEVLLRQVINQL